VPSSFSNFPELARLLFFFSPYHQHTLKRRLYSTSCHYAYLDVIGTWIRHLCNESERQRILSHQDRSSTGMIFVVPSHLLDRTTSAERKVSELTASCSLVSYHPARQSRSLDSQERFVQESSCFSARIFCGEIDSDAMLGCSTKHSIKLKAFHSRKERVEHAAKLLILIAVLISPSWTPSTRMLLDPSHPAL
jgi:hypothetical protein